MTTSITATQLLLANLVETLTLTPAGRKALIKPPTVAANLLAAVVWNRDPFIRAAETGRVIRKRRSITATKSRRTGRVQLRAGGVVIATAELPGDFFDRFPDPRELACAVADLLR